MTEVVVKPDPIEGIMTSPKEPVPWPINKEADQMTPSQRLKLREEFRKNRLEREQAAIRGRRKVAKVITGDEAKMLQLEVFLGPQDDIPKLEDALVEIGEMRINRLSEMLSMFDPRGLQAPDDMHHQKEAVARLLEGKLFTTPLQPENIVPLLELRTETKRLSDRDLDEQHIAALKEVRSIVALFPHDDRTRKNWSKFLPSKHLAGKKRNKLIDLKDTNNFGMVVDMLRQLTLNEWKVLKEVATEGLTGKETNLVASLISEKTGLNGADSATHVLARALSVLHRTARVQDMESKHVLSALAEVMAGLKEKGITEKSRLERK